MKVVQIIIICYHEKQVTEENLEIGCSSTMPTIKKKSQSLLAVFLISNQAMFTLP